MTDIHEKDHLFDVIRGLEIAVDHTSPLLLLDRTSGRIAVARKIDEVESVIDIIEVDRTCLTRCRARTGEVLSIDEGIDKGGLSDVGSSRHDKFRFSGLRKLGFYAQHSLQIYRSDLHGISFS